MTTTTASFNEPAMSPWGSVVNSKHPIEDLPIWYVATDIAFGGYMVDLQWALDNLSTITRDASVEYGDYLCFDQTQGWYVFYWDFSKMMDVSVIPQFTTDLLEEKLRSHYPGFIEAYINEFTTEFDHADS